MENLKFARKEYSTQKKFTKNEMINKLKKIPFNYKKVKWREITTLGIGNAELYLCEPDNDLELKKILLFCKEKNLNFYIVGAGSNLVGTDKKIYDFAIKLSGKFFRAISFGREHVTAGAGVLLKDLAIESAKKGFGGLSDLAGIPATLGGAIKMNASCKSTKISDFIEELCGFDLDGNIWKATKNEISFSYRTSSISDDKIILAVILSLPHSKTEKELTAIENSLKERKKIRFEGRNAGCVFMNPGSAKAGILLDKSNCKGLSIGDAIISSKHANYFINKGNCTENDFLKLISKARKIVFNKTGILLRPELKFVNKKSFEKIFSKPTSLKVAILKGGNSRERDISLVSASFVSSALKDAGFIVSEFDIKTPEIPDEAKKADIVFPVLHGGFGENGEIQKKLENLNIKFVGSSSKSCKITIDKIESKKIMLKHKIPTPDFKVITKQNLNEIEKIAKNFGFPLVVKPPLEGSTFGITIVENMDNLRSAVEETFSYGENILIEKFISGREITVGILDGKPLPVIEIEYPGKTYDFDAKYTHTKGETKYHCPPVNISKDLQKKAQKYALKFYRAVKARDMLRVDFICSQSIPYALEGNSIPGFTDSSLLPKAAEKDGLSFTELCAKLVIKTYKRK